MGPVTETATLPSPTSTPQPPEKLKAVEFVIAPDAGENTETRGATVSTRNVRAALTPVIGTQSTCRATAV